MDLGIAGRKAIVCASSRGLGRGCALALAQAGCELVINGRDAIAFLETDRADVVLMGVGHQDCLDLAVADCLEIRQRVISRIFRVHPAIEKEPVMANLQMVRIGPDLRMPCQIREFQMRLR